MLITMPRLADELSSVIAIGLRGSPRREADSMLANHGNWPAWTVILGHQLHLSRFAIMTRDDDEEVCGTAMRPPPLPSCCMLRDSKNLVPTGRYGRDGDAVW
jgi:hypothetical protein